jgi:hypothetical protein
VGIVDSRVQALAAEWTGQMPRVADQEPSLAGHPVDEAPVHPKRRRPGDVLELMLAGDPSSDQIRHHRHRPIGGRALELIWVEVTDERDLAIVGQRAEQDVAFCRRDERGAVPRQPAAEADVA